MFNIESRRARDINFDFNIFLILTHNDATCLIEDFSQIIFMKCVRVKLDIKGWNLITK